MSTNIENILIIGSGSAGLTAAIYAARAGFSPLVLTGIQPGGQLTITTDVENYPGFQDVVQGPWLMEQMQKQAENVGARIEYDLIVDLDKDVWPFKVKTDSGKEIQAETIIIATGAQARWLGIESEEKYNGKGVSACATCDGFFFKNKNVADFLLNVIAQLEVSWPPMLKVPIWVMVELKSKPVDNVYSKTPSISLINIFLPSGLKARPNNVLASTCDETSIKFPV